VKPPPFDYAAPSGLEEAVAALEHGGEDAKVLAGGQSLVPLLAFRLAYPSLLVDLNRIPELAYVEPTDDGGVAVGALTRTGDVEDSGVVRRRAPLVADAVPLIGHRQIRNRGTFGGSVAHADPAAELPGVVWALGATMRAVGPGGERTIPASEFFQGYFTTALEPAEVLAEVRIPPLPERSGTAFMEISRRHGDFALVAVAATVTLGSRDRCEAVRLVFAGVADAPVPVDVAGVLRGEAVSEEAARAAGEEAASGLTPSTDIHASGAYRKQVAAVLARRALLLAAERAASTNGGTA
jgi:carbon-monoxide dehydrogenase medium subunit